MKTLIALSLLILILFASHTRGPATSGAKAQAKGEEDVLLWGVTTDKIPYEKRGKEKELDNLVRSVAALVAANKDARARVVTRVIIDPANADERLPFPRKEDYADALDDELKHYEEAVSRIKQTGSWVMVELADSHDFHVLKRDGALKQKAEVYMDRLGTLVDIWEVGNEVNGEWTGWKDGKHLIRELMKKSPAELEKKRAFVAKQTLDAFNVVSGRGKKTALTLFYNGGKTGEMCWDIEGYDMPSWAEKYILTTPMKDKLNYVLVSFYDDDCAGVKTHRVGRDSEADLKQDAEKFAAVFAGLARDFKPAKVGFGEMGPRCKDISRGDPRCLDQQSEYVRRYYGVYDAGIKAALPGQYVGGYFYWYFYQDMRPADKPALTDLKHVVGGVRQ